MIARLFTLGALLFLSLPAMASGEGGGGAALLQPKYGTIFWTALTFLVMLFILGRYAWGPLLGVLDERSKTIQDSLDHAAREREEVIQGVSERYLERYRVWIERYYQALQESHESQPR